MTESESEKAGASEVVDESRRMARVERLVQALTKAMHGLAREGDQLEELLEEARQELARVRAENEQLREVAEAATAYVIGRGTASEEDCEAADRQLTRAALQYASLQGAELAS